MTRWLMTLSTVLPVACAMPNLSLVALLCPTTGPTATDDLSEPKICHDGFVSPHSSGVHDLVQPFTMVEGLSSAVIHVLFFTMSEHLK